MERLGWTAAELEVMTPADRDRLFGQFDDSPEFAHRARDIIRETLQQY